MEHRQNLPVWVSGALGKAVARNPDERYNVLSAFLADLTRPNPQFETMGALPILERDPLIFWRTAALIMAALNLILLFALIG